MIDPRYIREAGDDLPPVEYNYSWPDNESTETTGEKYVPASAEEIERHPWLKHFEVSTVKGAPNGGRCPLVAGFPPTSGSQPTSSATRGN